MSWDSVDQLIEARNGVYSDWHPPFMALLWHFTDRIIQGPLGMLLLITGLIWLGTFLVTLNWFNDDRKFTVLSLVPALTVFYPPLFGISGAIWKDNLMWAFLIVTIGIAGALEPVTPTRRWRTYANLAIIASLLLMAMLVRHNAGFAAVPIMTLAILRSIRKSSSAYRFAVSGAIGLLVCVLLQFCAGATTEYLTTFKTNPWASLAIFDVGGIIYRMADHQQQQTFYHQLPARLQGAASVDRLLETYDPGDWCAATFGSLGELLALRTGADAATNAGLTKKEPAFHCVMDPDPWAPPNNAFDVYCLELTEQENRSLLQLWSTLVIHYPLAWLSHRFSVFHGLIGPNQYDIVYMDQHPVDWAAIYGEPTPQPTRLQVNVKSLLVHLRPIFTPWIYLALATVVIGACLVSLTEERLYIVLIAASGLAHEGGLFLVSPSADYRYSHYMVYTSMLALLLSVRTYLIRRLREAADGLP
jgi:hypothetical protein